MLENIVRKFITLEGSVKTPCVLSLIHNLYNPRLIKHNGKLKNSSVIVIGATGFLGTEICRQLLEAKIKVKGLVRTSSDPAKVRALQDME